MRKLSLLAYFLVGAMSLWAASPKNVTYSVQATPFATEFGNNFAYYHVNLNLQDLTRVAKNGNIQVAIEFEKGMDIKETRFEKKPNGAIYYVTDFSTPRYRAIISDQEGTVLSEKSYGGFDKSMDFGKERSYSESDLAEKWLNEKDRFLQKVEFQNLDFSELEADLLAVLETMPELNRVANNVSASSTPRTNFDESALTGKTSNENTFLEDVDASETTQEINEAAAAEESEVLKDPFAELNEPVEDEELAANGQSAPDAPVDYEATASEEQEKVAKKEKKPSKKERITPVMSEEKNIVKLNLPNLAFGNLTLNYERVLSARNSVTLNLGYIRPQSVNYLVPTEIENGEVELEGLIDNRFSGLTATLEYRMYGKKKGAPKGFFYAPYLRYANYSYDFTDEFDTESSTTTDYYNIESKLSTVGLGIQIGFQWFIADRISIDWGLLGVAAQYYTFSSTFTSTDDSFDYGELEAEFTSDIDDTPLSSSGLEFTASEDNLKLKWPLLFGGARTYLSVGYKF
ncbi:MAG: hypothetical protein AAF960_07010 [Bacteroidota bacterium]